MSNANNINLTRQLYAELNEGQKIYLANKLFKEDRIVAQKIKQYIPESVLLPAPTYKVGDEILVKAKVTAVDAEDPVDTYCVFIEDGEATWFSEAAIAGLQKDGVG